MLTLPSRLLIIGFLGGSIFGCTSTAPTVAPPPEPGPSTAPIVQPPLPGTDSLLVQDVSETFDSTFVAFKAEQSARENYLRGQELFDRVEDILADMIGPSSLPDTFSTEGEGNVDTVAFELVNQEARQVLANAAKAQLARDSTTALTLLGEAQQLFERAVSLNPWYEEAQYQLAQIYRIRASNFWEAEAWNKTLEILRELVKLRANEHGLWAEIAVALENINLPIASGLSWRQAAEVVLDNSRLAFEMTPPPADSSALFTYNVRAYRAFVDGRYGEGVRLSLRDAWGYATTEEEREFAFGELFWALWDFHNFENRLVFDSLKAAVANDPPGALAGLDALMSELTRSSAIRDVRYNHAVTSHDLGYQDEALDALNSLWHDTVHALEDSSVISDTQTADLYLQQGDFVMATRTLTTNPVPYPEFMENLSEVYATFLFERALLHRQEGASALAFTYLMQVAEIKSSLTGKAFIEALNMARYNPSQALELEPQIEEVYATLDHEDKLAYLTQMGRHHRRLGNNEEVAAFLQRYRELRNSVSN